MAQEHQISFLKKANPDVLEHVISLLIDTLAVQFNVKDNFSGIQIVDCTLTIIEKYWYLRPEEIMFVFKQGKLGFYGPVYNKLDTHTILSWIHKYDTEERIRQVEIQRDSFKNAEGEPQIDIMKAYLSEQKALQENNGVPTLVIESRAKKEQQLAERRGQMEYEQFQEEYFKNRSASTEKIKESSNQ